jgi:hypothetical protein
MSQQKLAELLLLKAQHTMKCDQVANSVTCELTWATSSNTWIITQTLQHMRFAKLRLVRAQHLRYDGITPLVTIMS